jgi:hypothetical protein
MEKLSWVSHPVKRNRRNSILVSVFLVILWAVVYIVTSSALFLVLSVVIMLGSLSPFYLPTRYELTEDEVKVNYVFRSMEKSWTSYRSYYPDKNGVLLSPFPRPSRLESFRGVYIRFEGNKEAVLGFIREKMEKEDA